MLANYKCNSFLHRATLLAPVILLILLPYISCDPIPLTKILPKLEAIHQDAESLLIKNSELKAKILIGLQSQPKTAKNKTGTIDAATTSPGAQTVNINSPNKDTIDFVELEEFNKWVETNLEYAVKNTQATIETLKEEAGQVSGIIDYSEQAIQDGIEGVKYWQSAVIFQDKTLKNEKFEVE